ncbi:hypothetical protein V2J09_000398 [Rumex salicifolius]
MEMDGKNKTTILKKMKRDKKTDIAAMNLTIGEEDTENTPTKIVIGSDLPLGFGCLLSPSPVPSLPTLSFSPVLRPPSSIILVGFKALRKSREWNL